MSGPNWERLPADLKYVSQWCIAAPDKSPYSTAGHRASVIDPSQWTDWYSACMVAQQWGNGSGIGFVLDESDEFTCIDLDVKDTTTPEEIARYERIIEAFDSYTERSTSGRGYHIWIRGVVGAGCRRDGVEVYSQQRFIICTGNVFRDKPVENRQTVLDMLVSDIRSQQDEASAAPLVEVAQVESDDEIWNKAVSAGNGAKFSELFAGQWYGKPEYPSQSEADIALLSMFTFYSPSNAQCKRMFRASELGKRDKATRNDKYIDRTLGHIRGRMAREAVATAHGEQLSIAFVSRAIKAPGPKLVVDTPSTLDWPPGPLGEMAKWLYSVAPRPVREVAIITALGIFAGCYGRAYNISNSGLNLYLVLVAPSGVGKEAIHSGASKIVNTLVSVGVPAMDSAVDFSDYASGPALVKSIAERGSFCNIAGEWGRKLRKMSDDATEGPMSSLRTVMTNLYQKSGAGTIVGGIGYSDKEKDVKSTDGVAYSMLGETTPATFYESLTNTMMQDGFMSRFIVIEYNGMRPASNSMMNEPVPDWFVSMMGNFFHHAAQQAPGKAFDVPMDHESQSMLDTFNLECDDQINSNHDDESWRQMWNRAHLKALKVSALLAVAKNYMSPIVTKEDADWALDLIRRDIRIMSRKMTEGDVGDSDMVRERKLISILIKYLRDPIAPGYKLPDAMRVAGVVARKYLQNKTHQVNSFAKSRLGQSAELDKQVRSLMDSGYLVEVSKDKIPLEWGSVGRCFRILTLPDVV